MVTELQPSWAVATPVWLVLVSAGHSSVRLAGAVIVGGVVSLTVMVWTALALLPQASVAVQVRAITSVPPQLFVTASLKVIVTELHPSCAVATPVWLVLVSAGHSSVRLAGAVMLGGLVSLTVMVWTALALLPQASVAVQVRAITSVPPQLFVTASLK